MCLDWRGVDSTMEEETFFCAKWSFFGGDK